MGERSESLVLESHLSTYLKEERKLAEVEGWKRGSLALFEFSEQAQSSQAAVGRMSAA